MRFAGLFRRLAPGRWQQFRSAAEYAIATAHHVSSS
jgi:hypothetical protein